MGRPEFLTIKNAGMVVEILCGVRREEGGMATFGEAAFHLRMTMQIARQTIGYDLSLGDQPASSRQPGGDLLPEKRIVGTSQQHRIDLRGLGQQLIGIGPDKIIRARGIVLVIFYQGNP